MVILKNWKAFIFQVKNWLILKPSFHNLKCLVAPLPIRNNYLVRKIDNLSNTVFNLKNTSTLWKIPSL